MWKYCHKFNFFFFCWPDFSKLTLNVARRYFDIICTLSQWLYSPILGLGRHHETFRFISVTRSRTVGWTPWTGDQLVARTLLTAPGDCDNGEVGGMNDFGRGNRSTRRKPTPTPLCPPQIPLARPGSEPGPPRGKPATNRFSYGAADIICTDCAFSPLPNAFTTSNTITSLSELSAVRYIEVDVCLVLSLKVFCDLVSSVLAIQFLLMTEIISAWCVLILKQINNEWFCKGFHWWPAELLEARSV
jgi:hypothetical protein